MPHNTFLSVFCVYTFFFPLLLFFKYVECTRKMSIWHSEVIIEQRTAGRKAQEGKASMVGKKERTAKKKPLFKRSLQFILKCCPHFCILIRYLFIQFFFCLCNMEYGCYIAIAFEKVKGIKRGKLIFMRGIRLNVLHSTFSHLRAMLFFSLFV